MLSTIFLVCSFFGVLANGCDVTVSPCGKNLKTDTKFDYFGFHTANGGSWIYKRIPDTDANKNVKAQTYKATPLADKKGFEIKLVQQLNTDESVTVVDGATVYSSGEGTGKVMESYKGANYTVYFMKYYPKRCAYYFVCQAEGCSNTVDSRYVMCLPNITLNQKEIKEIDAIDKQFKGTLKPV